MIDSDGLEKIRNVLKVADPYSPDGSEESDDDRTDANQDLLVLAYDHLPELLNEIESARGQDKVMEKEKTARRMAKLEVTSELIRDALALPDDAKICAISKSSQDPDVYVVFV